ncbi:MAG: hypothetical protein OXC40_07980 [Proteobacteria bacterium]|nr:hypothetical protein [Pseudomonadota bacterium]
MPVKIMILVFGSSLLLHSCSSEPDDMPSQVTKESREKKILPDQNKRQIRTSAGKKSADQLSDTESRLDDQCSLSPSSLCPSRQKRPLVITKILPNNEIEEKESNQDTTAEQDQTSEDVTSPPLTIAEYFDPHCPTLLAQIEAMATTINSNPDNGNEALLRDMENQKTLYDFYCEDTTD